MDNGLFDQIFQLKFTAKQLERASKRAEKEGQKKRKLMVASIQKGNVEFARVYGADVVRKKNESLNYLRLAAKVDGIRSRLETVQASKQITGTIQKLSQQLNNLDVLDVQKVSFIMNEFEKKFEDIEVATDVIDTTMSSATANMAKQDDVDDLIRQVADEYSLELKTLLPEIAAGAGKQQVQQPAAAAHASSQRKVGQQAT